VDTILIVEDESLIASSIKNILSHLGYKKVYVANSGVGALKIIEEKHPDLILADIVLDDKINGIELAKQVRAHHKIPFIFVTAYSDEDTVNKAKLSEPYGYITKPFKKNDLKIAIDIALHKFEIEKKLIESETKLKTIFESAPDAYYLNDLKGTFIDGNKAAENLLGYKKEELVGKNFLKLKLLSVKELAKASKLLLKNVQGKGTGPDEFVLHHKDGTQVSIEIRTFPVQIKDKTVVLGIARDISQRKQAEEALRNREAQLSNAAEIAKLGYWEYDVDSNLFTFNDHFYNIFRTTAEKVGGYTMTPTQYANQFLHPDDMPDVAIEMKKAMETTDPNFSRTLEHRIIYADGEPGYISARFYVVKDSQGHTIKTYGANQDITERKVIENELRDSEIRYHNLFENSSEFLFTLDLKGNFTDVNKAAEDLTGYTKSELLKMNFKDYTPKKYHKKLFHTFFNIYKTGTPLHDYPIEAVMKDKSVKFFETSFSIMKKGGQVIGFQGSSKDISQHKKAEEIQETLYHISNAINTVDSLPELYEKIRVFLGNVLDTTNFYISLYSKDDDSISFVSYADVTFDRKGYLPAGRKFGKGLTEYVISSCKPLFATKQKQDELAKQGKIEVIGARSEIWLGVPLKIENHVIGIIAVQSYDDPNRYSEKDIEVLIFVSEEIALAINRKQVEEKLRKAYSQLEDTQQELIQSQTLAALGEFSSGIAHEIRNPLANISASAQYCINTFDLTKKVKNYLRIIIRNSNKANRIIKELLDFARPRELIFKERSILQPLNKACELTRATRFNNNIRLYKRCSKALPKILMDEKRIEQGLLNIIVNSIDSMSKGGRLSIIAYLEKEYIVIEISDTGKGIPKQDISKIFNPFFTNKSNGVGLGLSVTHRIIQSHKGKIEIESKYHKGTKFTIKLPIFQDENKLFLIHDK